MTGMLMRLGKHVRSKTFIKATIYAFVYTE